MGNRIIIIIKKEEAEEVSIPVGPGDDVAGEVGSGGGRGWLKDYVDRLASSVSSNNSSSSISISNSFRFFTGSSRRSTADGSSRRRSGADVVNNGGSWDFEGEEIGNFLRWLSGV
ncbi:hypothetical protein IFM89_004818 [Coptis chinensis]|uniref:Uncharacterized protein n=1 Tax=Coptis chinensis TaxID=261450 RepID=A0A835MBQ0_9MAGN|nr:hypothetical protein IFM89_004818 [Coptis chinensis]